MAATSDAFLILHGWGGNKPEHWQEWLAVRLGEAGKDVRYPKMPDPENPRLGAWIAAVHDEVRALPPPETVTVLCHSLGAITWMHYVHGERRHIAERALLVAPPYVSRDLPPADTPPGIAGFFPAPLDSAAIAISAGETTLICGEGDCYGTEDQTKAYAESLDIPMYVLPRAGHVSPYWGYGDWPWLLDWCLGRAGLPPLARS
jgi:predicted alpha/beta hydrolase family esterase